ncbi:hypothetical protein AB5I41_17380 [Sphingomonas sp. MMS24-JH45]
MLYRRYLMADGVSAKPEKVAQRAVLAAISTAVHRREVAAPGGGGDATRLKDDLDRFGLLLPYMAAPDAAVARALASAAVMYWSAGDRAVAMRLARRSLAERPLAARPGHRGDRGAWHRVAARADVPPGTAAVARAGRIRSGAPVVKASYTQVLARKRRSAPP